MHSTGRGIKTLSNMYVLYICHTATQTDTSHTNLIAKGIEITLHEEESKRTPKCTQLSAMKMETALVTLNNVD